MVNKPLPVMIYRAMWVGSLAGAWQLGRNYLFVARSQTEQSAQFLSLNNEVFRLYLLCSVVLVLKLMSSAWWTVDVRIRYFIQHCLLCSNREFRRNAFFHPEDHNDGDPKIKPVTKHPDVSRIKRIHYNDIESITYFLIIGFLYVLTGPSLFAAQVIFYGYTVIRMIHTAILASGIEHTFRAMVWICSIILTWSMCFEILKVIGY